MFLYYCADPAALPALRQDGLGADGPIELHTSLEAAQAACGGLVLVVAPEAGAEAARKGRVWVEAVAPDAFQNLDPYLPPVATTAAGGYIVRTGSGEPDVLLIFRRGVWDLPKGKLDEGEALEACALREVREEVGIQALELVRALGTTVHGYPEKGRYHVKTTHWYLMRTTETAFTPQAEEDIEAIAWVPWSQAREQVGFETLRQHMREVEATVLGSAAVP